MHLNFSLTSSFGVSVKPSHLNLVYRFISTCVLLYLNDLIIILKDQQTHTHKLYLSLRTNQNTSLTSILKMVFTTLCL